MKHFNLLKTTLLLCALIVGSLSGWADTPVVIWSENFGSYSADATPSGGTYSYVCTNGTGTSPGNTKVMNENLAGGAAKPELMVGKKGSGSGAAGGKFTAVIPLDNFEGTLTLTYFQNKQSLKVSSTTTGVSGGQTIKPSTAGQQTTTFTGITTSMTSITIVFEATTTNNVRLDDIVLVGNKAAAGTTAPPSINGDTPFMGNTLVTISNAANADGASIYYTLDGSDPTTTASETCFAYSAPFTIDTTTTVKAIAKKSTDSNASSVVSKTFTKVIPKTVAEAITAIDVASPAQVNGVYVKGIISKIDTYSENKYITYWISDDGLTTNQFEVYKGLGIDGAAFTSIDDIKIGDVVVVYGDIKKFNSTYEFNTGSRLVIHKQKVLNPTVSPAAGAVAVGTMVTISTATEGATIYYTTDGTNPTTESSVYSAPITINAATTIKAIAVRDGFPNSDVVEASYTIAAPVATPTFSLAEGTYTSIQTVTISTDTEEADIYYTVDGSEPTTSNNKYSEPISVGETMTIKAIAVKDGMANSAVASATYTINLPDYAELPFSFNKGKSDIESIIGLTQTGLGADYSSSPKLKFDNTGDNLVLKINEIPGLLSFDIKGNTFSGGTFKVQTSVDGVNYSDLNTYSSLDDTQSEKFDLSADIRYIKWIYTSKSSGNVGIGNIVLTNTKEITISSAGWATYCSSAPLDFTNVTTLTAFTASKDGNGNVVKFNKVTGKVPANTGLLVRGEIANVPVCASAEAVSNLLFGVTTDTPKGAGTVFVLMKGSKGIGFYKNTNDFTLRANSAYLRAEDVEGSTARAFISLDDETTGIADVKAVKEDAEGMFDLQGRKIAKPTKGLYIVNGKKIVVK